MAVQARTPIRLAIITNIPTPYRVPVYKILDDGVAVRLHVIYTARTEPNRSWDIPTTAVASTTLRSRVITWKGRYIHFSWGATAALKRFRPDVVLTTGFNPPQLAAFAWCIAHRVPHICQTDGTVSSEAKLTWAHRLVRRIVAARTAAFVAASDQGAELQRQWGAPVSRIFCSPLAVDNDHFATRGQDRIYDFIFSGQLNDTKDPIFAMRVAVATSLKVGRTLRMAVVGGGPLEPQVRTEAFATQGIVNIDVYGPTPQSHLPDLYGSSKILLMPTRWDPWGLVINEASAAGAVPIVSESAGAAGELVIDGETGFVCERDIDSWVQAASELLQDNLRWQRLSNSAATTVQAWSFANAAAGLRTAARAASGGGHNMPAGRGPNSR